MIPASGAGGPGFNSRNSPIFPTHKYRHARTCKPTPVGFEPTRGDPIGLAGRRLNHSAKVSLARTPWAAERTPFPANPPSQTKDRTCALRTNTPTTITSKRPRGPMDKASAHGAGDCRFESCRGHLRPAPTAKPGGACKNRHRGDSNSCGQSPVVFESISLTARTQCHAHSRERNTPRHRKPKNQRNRTTHNSAAGN